MDRNNDNTVKTPARSEDGVTVDPIDPNPGRQSSGRTSGGRKGASNPNSGASRARSRSRGKK